MICLSLLSTFFALVSASEVSTLSEESDNAIRSVTQQSFASFDLEHVYTGYIFAFHKSSDNGFKHITAIMDAASKSAKARGFVTALAVVDAEKESSLSKDFEIEKFPTLVHTRNGKRVKYTDTIGVASILKYLAKVERTSLYDIDSEEVLNAFKTPYDSGRHPYVVAQFKGTKDDMQGTKTYMSLATAAKEGEVPIAAQYGQPSEKITIYTEGESGKMEGSVYTGPTDIPEAIDAWIIHTKVPLITFLNPDNARDVLRRHFTTMVVLALTTKEIAELRGADTGAVQAFRTAATKYKHGGSSAPKFVVIDTESSYCRRFMGHYHGGMELPSRNIIYSEGADDLTRYLLSVKSADGHSTADEITSFVDNAIKGNLEPFRLSQKTPENIKDVAKVLVRDTFKSKVLESEGDIMVEFFAPWCGHCRNFAPVYEKVAEKIADGNHPLSVYKIDAVGNDLRDFVDIPGFPTILYYKAGAKDKPVDYRGHGGLTEADVLKFALDQIANSARDEL